MSNDLTACVPGPTCQSKAYDLTSLNNVVSIDKYLGDASSTDWQSQGDPQIYNGDSTLLTMAQGTVGTLLASTHYVWYGKVCATLSTAQGQGVVTAFILMSDVKDEIDFEWIGVDTGKVQSNYYAQGNTVCKSHSTPLRLKPTNSFQTPTAVTLRLAVVTLLLLCTSTASTGSQIRLTGLLMATPCVP